MQYIERLLYLQPADLMFYIILYVCHSLNYILTAEHQTELHSRTLKW